MQQNSTFIKKTRSTGRLNYYFSLFQTIKKKSKGQRTRNSKYQYVDK